MQSRPHMALNVICCETARRLELGGISGSARLAPETTLMTPSGHEAGRNPAAQQAPDLMLANRYAVSLVRGGRCNSVK